LSEFDVSVVGWAVPIVVTVEVNVPFGWIVPMTSLTAAVGLPRNSSAPPERTIVTALRTRAFPLAVQQMALWFAVLGGLLGGLG